MELRQGGQNRQWEERGREMRLRPSESGHLGIQPLSTGSSPEGTAAKLRLLEQPSDDEREVLKRNQEAEGTPENPGLSPGAGGPHQQE